MARANGLPGVQLTQQNLVPSCATPKRLMHFLRSRNPRVDRRYARLADYYVKYGRKLGIRWDVGFLQMLVETNNLSFRRPDGSPSDVRPGHNNFAGIGALGDGRPGDVFVSIGHGVRAHLEHVLHYAGANVIAPIAERTRKVQMWRVLADWHKGFERPITYSDLARRWAPQNPAYLTSIERLAELFQNRYCDGQPVILMPRSSRPPEIAQTAWRFEKRDGKLGSAGVTPPTGRPDFAANRTTLGASSTVGPAQPPLPSADRPRQVAAVMRRPIVTRPVATKPPALSKNERIRQMLGDRKILLRTHVGAIIPIAYTSNGKMVGDAGSLGFFLGSSRDRGRWWAKNGKLCQKWRIWLDRETHCMTLKERNGTIWWKADDGKSGTARIVAKSER